MLQHSNYSNYLTLDQIHFTQQQTEVEVCMDKVIEEDCIILITMEMTIEETVLDIYKIIEVKILEVDMEGIIEMINLEEVEVGLETDNIQVIL